MNAGASYRPDIDGLRAIAVLSVVFYHFNVWPFTGGFVGVDIFFVVSGFLITSILYQEAQKTGAISLLAFYDRRIRRILPALVAVVACALIAGFILLLPDDYTRLGAQSAASLTGWANFYFFYNLGYFDREAELQPLLHIWSLAVEEQFYIAWPILLALLARTSARPEKLIAIFLIAVVLVSLGASIYNVQIDQERAAFFMPHTRAWELALGALIVFLPSIKNSSWSLAAALIGLLLITHANLTLTDKDPFPGLNSVFPCVGAALLIWPRREPTVVARVLSWPPMVFLGLISYSLYLWHWLLLVFFRTYVNNQEPNDTETGILLFVAIALAILSWKYIETPFRSYRPGPMRSVAFGSATGAALATVGILIFQLHGFPDRISADARHYAAFLKYESPRRGGRNCISKSEKSAAQEADEDCVKGNRDRPNVLLMGDSHATHFGAALEAAFPGVNFWRVTASQCRPVLESKGKESCVELMQRAYAKIIPASKFDAVILSARWRNGQHEQVAASVAYLKKHVKEVIVFGQTMEYRDSLPAILIRTDLPRRGGSIEESGMYGLVRSFDKDLRRSLADGTAKYFSVLDAICPDQKCLVTTPDNAPLQRDYGHLTYEGALYVLTRFKAAGLRFDTVGERPCGSEECRATGSAGNDSSRRNR